jgi:GntR family transcriptional regulator
MTHEAAQLDKTLPIPLYHQLQLILQDLLKQGHWKANDKMPTEDALGARFQVSKATVRQSLQALAQAGLIRREQGRGTFVADTRIQFGPRILTSFTDEMRHSGMPAGSRVLEQSAISAAEDLAAKLRLEPGTPVFRIYRLRLAEGEPMGLQTAYIACELVPGLLDFDFSTQSFYDTLERHYQLPPDHASQMHCALALDAEQAHLLGVREGAPALGGERLTFLRSGRPLELTNSIMRGDRYQIQLKLSRPHTH